MATSLNGNLEKRRCGSKDVNHKNKRKKKHRDPHIPSSNVWTVNYLPASAKNVERCLRMIGNMGSDEKTEWP